MSSHLVALVQQHDITDDKLSKSRGFTLFLRAYTYDSASGTFEAVPGMPSHLPGQIKQALTALHNIATKGASSNCILCECGRPTYLLHQTSAACAKVMLCQFLYCPLSAEAQQANTAQCTVVAYLHSPIQCARMSARLGFGHYNVC